MNRRHECGYGVLVPIKSLRRAKSRLTIGSSSLRSELAMAFFLDTIAALKASSQVESIVVVSPDPAVGRAVGRSCDVVSDPELGLAEAIRAGAARLQSIGHRGPAAVVLPDLPCATARSFDALFAAASHHPRAFVSDWKGDGTTCVTAATVVLLTHHFGESSAAAHACHGFVPIELSIPDLRADVDTPSDMRRMQASELGSTTRSILARSIGAIPEAKAEIATR
ncbi:hypothetical protein WSS_A43700 [Rhodococcus opacus M213]|uniref:MobA-like NTP transferase domain-containing protein n=2 Tax=Rhodococcus opacus TaxID=37919 RepID=K8X453_RHOOP|nr:hypothetical protein WSS_A43700 [Rhodococcus opacus M213]